LASTEEDGDCDDDNRETGEPRDAGSPRPRSAAPRAPDATRRFWIGNRTDRPVQGRVLFEDLPVETPDWVSGLDSELIDEVAPKRCIRCERLGLAARAVKREHQRSLKRLPRGVPLCLRLELRKDSGVIAECKRRFGQPLEDLESHLVQARRLGPDRRFARQVGNCGAPPERERLPRQRCDLLRVVPTSRRRLGHEALEDVPIQPVAVFAEEAITSRCRHKSRRIGASLAKRSPKSRHACL
jgi:hypothetical protein